jgi:hypothetical protein
MRRSIAFFIFVYLVLQGFESVVRWVLDMAHAGALIYARDAFLLIAIALSVCLLLRESKNVSRTFWLVWFVAIGSLIALSSGLRVEQVLFGIKIWLPFMAGFLLVESQEVARLNRPRFWAIVWCLLCLGIFINYFYRYPWTGLSYRVGNVDVVANREWSAGSIPRLSGFSRSSFDAAASILILFVYLVSTVKNRLTRLLLVILSGLAIALTTTKGIMAVFVGTLLFLPLQSGVGAHVVRFKKLASGTICLIAAIGLIFPIVSLRIPLPQLRKGSIEDWLFGSLLDRAWTTWPDAFGWLSDWQLLIGRGIGGIGTPQYLFESPLSASPADNMFVYLYVTAGLIGAAFYAFSSWAGTYLSYENKSDRLVFLLQFCLFGYGITANVIEESMLAMVYGGVFSFIFMRFGAHFFRVAAPVVGSPAPTEP